MNNDLISRSALKKDLKQYFTDGVLDGVSARLTFNQILHDIDNAPTVNPDMDFAKECYANGYEDGKNERSQGEWLKSDIPESVLVKCSICGFDCGSYTHNFCPNCGAKMKGGENGMMGNIQNDRDCEHCAHYVKAGLDWDCCESWECEFKPKGDGKND